MSGLAAAVALPATTPAAAVVAPAVPTPALADGEFAGLLQIEVAAAEPALACQAVAPSSAEPGLPAPAETGSSPPPQVAHNGAPLPVLAVVAETGAAADLLVTGGAPPLESAPEPALAELVRRLPVDDEMPAPAAPEAGVLALLAQCCPSPPLPPPVESVVLSSALPAPEVRPELAAAGGVDCIGSVPEAGRIADPGSDLPLPPDLLAAPTAAVTPSPAASATIPASAPAPPPSAPSVDVRQADWPEQLSERIRWVLDGGVQEARIELAPADLGPLDLRVQLDRGQVQLHIGAAHAATRELLSEALPRLRELMGDSGLSLGQTSVSSQQERAPSWSSPRGRSGPGLAAEEEAEALNWTPVRVSRGLLDHYA